MPVHAPHWTQFLTCLICYNEFDVNQRRPITLGCGHTLCKSCLLKLQQKQCPFDKLAIHADLKDLPENYALMQLVGGKVPTGVLVSVLLVPKDEQQNYLSSRKCIEELALYLIEAPTAGASNVQTSLLSRPMQKKLVALVNCQLVEEEGRARAMRAARSLGERSVTELLLQHQNALQLSANLWASVRVRGGQFLGPAMQEEVLKLVLLALEDGSALCRKVLIMFVVQRLAPHFPHASKTSIGHVVQLLYRASCFKVSKREGDSSLMELKEEFRTYNALRWEHDAQIVQIATEAGLRITPEQWSSLLYGDTAHKSHMQSIIDKLQTPQSFSQSVQELVIALQRTGDPGNLASLRPQYELLAGLDASQDASAPLWKDIGCALEAARLVVKGLMGFMQNFRSRKQQEDRQGTNTKYKTSMCRSLSQHRSCHRGINCIFAHSQEEMEMYRAKNKKKSRNSSPQFKNSGLSSECNTAHREAASNVANFTMGNRPEKSSMDEIASSHSFELQLPRININSSGQQQSGQTSIHSASTSTPCLRVLLHPEPNLNLESRTFQPLNAASSSLAELHQRKKEIMAQLRKAESFDTACEFATKNELPMSAEKCTPDGISGLHSGSPRIPSGLPLYMKACDNSSLMLPNSPSTNSFCSSSDDVGNEDLTDLYHSSVSLFASSEKDEFIPFDPPFESKYGPISRCMKNPIDSSVSFPLDPMCEVSDLSYLSCSSIRPMLTSSKAALTDCTANKFMQLM